MDIELKLMYIILKINSMVKGMKNSFYQLRNLSHNISFFSLYSTFSIYKKDTCQWKSINLNAKNNFCSSVRSSIIYDNSLVLACDDGSIVTWDLKTYKKKFIFDTNSDYTRRALVKTDDKIISGSSNMKLYIHSLDGSFIKEKNYEKGTIFSVLPYQDKFYVAFGNAEIGIVSKKNLDLLYSYKKHEYLIYSLCFDEKNQLFYSGSDDNNIIAWNVLDTGQLNMKKSMNNFDGAIKHILKYKNSFIVSTGKGSILMYDTSFMKLLFQKKLDYNIISTLLIDNTLYVGDSIGRLFIFKIMKNSFELENTVVLDGLIRSIKKYKQNIIIITKTGFIRTIVPNRNE